MSKIRQADIYPNAISFTKASSFAITSTVAFAQGNLTKTAYAIGTVGGMATNDPIAIKEYDGFGANVGWADEQDWTLHNQGFTTVIPVITNGATVTSTTINNASISIGDLVGIFGGGAWSLAGSVNSAKDRVFTMGSQNAGLLTGGFQTAVTEFFNGSSWALGSNLLISKYAGSSAGSLNAGLVAGGATSSSTGDTELFNGSVWRASSSLNTNRQRHGGFGSQNAAAVAGGLTTTNTNSVEIFNGATWFASGALSAQKVDVAASGSQNAALVTGGSTGAISNVVELFNGTAWSLSTPLSFARVSHSMAGTTNAAVIAAGVTSLATNSAEQFNGSVWYAIATLSQTKSTCGGFGSQSETVVAAGSVGGPTAVTELHNQNIYRKITSLENYKTATNIGIAFNVTSLTLSVKFNGYVDGINVTSSNIFVTSAANWINAWVVFPRNSQNGSTTVTPGSILVKPIVAVAGNVGAIEADDIVIGKAISRTQMQVFFGNIFPYDRIGRW